MHTILTHFHLDSISHSGFGAIAMLPKRNQSLGRSSRQRKAGEFLKQLSITAVRLPHLFTAQPQAPAQDKAGACGWAVNGEGLQPHQSLSAVPSRSHTGTTITSHGLWNETSRAASVESTNTQTSAGENCERSTSPVARHSSSSELFVAPPDVVF